jgi:riboflavin kinase/FMN adenylyltransferase
MKNVLSIGLLITAFFGALITRFLLRHRHFVVEGPVTPGNQQGKKLGAATANLDIRLAGKLPKGLYACRVQIGKSTAEYRGLLYYGYNSLSKADCLEVHLFDFSADLYGEWLTITTHKFLRREKKFSDSKKLAEQIAKDIKKALKK